MGLLIVTLLPQPVEINPIPKLFEFLILDYLLSCEREKNDGRCRLFLRRESVVDPRDELRRFILLEVIRFCLSGQVVKTQP